MTNYTIVFLSPYIQTTAGHRNILRIVSAVVERMAEVSKLPIRLVPVYDSWPIRDHMITGLKPNLVLVDFPDDGQRDALTALRVKPELASTRFIALEMYAPDKTADPAPKPDYHLRIGLEPDVFEQTQGLVCIPPLINPDCVAPLKLEELAAWDSRKRQLMSSDSSSKHTEPALVMLSGTPSEKAYVKRMANQVYPGRDYILSDSLPQPAVRFARLTDRIMAAAGYSTAWELAYLGVARHVHWIAFDRPAEDCDRRMRVVTKLDGAIPAMEAELGTGRHNLVDILLHAMER